MSPNIFHTPPSMYGDDPFVHSWHIMEKNDLQRQYLVRLLLGKLLSPLRSPLSGRSTDSS